MRNAINPKRGCRGGLDAEIGKNPDRGEHEGPVFNEFQIGLRRDEFLKFFWIHVAFMMIFLKKSCFYRDVIPERDGGGRHE